MWAVSKVGDRIWNTPLLPNPPLPQHFYPISPPACPVLPPSIPSHPSSTAYLPMAVVSPDLVNYFFQNHQNAVVRLLLHTHAHTHREREGGLYPTMTSLGQTTFAGFLCNYAISEKCKFFFIEGWKYLYVYSYYRPPCWQLTVLSLEWNDLLLHHLFQSLSNFEAVFEQVL